MAPANLNGQSAMAQETDSFITPRPEPERHIWFAPRCASPGPTLARSLCCWSHGSSTPPASGDSRLPVISSPNPNDHLPTMRSTWLLSGSAIWLGACKLFFLRRRAR